MYETHWGSFHALPTDKARKKYATKVICREKQSYWWEGAAELVQDVEKIMKLYGGGP
jgi:hypothetical protein